LLLSVARLCKRVHVMWFGSERVSDRWFSRQENSCG
jgi:hypothetical protein